MARVKKTVKYSKISLTAGEGLEKFEYKQHVYIVVQIRFAKHGTMCTQLMQCVEASAPLMPYGRPHIQYACAAVMLLCRCICHYVCGC